MSDDTRVMFSQIEEVPPVFLLLFYALGWEKAQEDRDGLFPFVAMCVGGQVSTEAIYARPQHHDQVRSWVEDPALVQVMDTYKKQAEKSGRRVEDLYCLLLPLNAVVIHSLASMHCRAAWDSVGLPLEHPFLQKLKESEGKHPEDMTLVRNEALLSVAKYMAVTMLGPVEEVEGKGQGPEQEERVEQANIFGHRSPVGEA